MKLLTVTLGVQSAKWLPAGEPRQLSVLIQSEFVPDDVFRACNRIESLGADIARLATNWQGRLRRELDIKGYPSMSVDDTIHLETIGTWTCARRGWTFIPADRSLPL